MVEHHIQKDILYRLVTVPNARFADLKPDNIDGNIFTYHLHQLVKQKLIEKQEDGTYCLTAAGKAFGITINLSAHEALQQAHSVLLMAIRNSAGEWLLRKRLAHPMYGKIGFLHSEPALDKPIVETAADCLLKKMGLKADFVVRGSGYIRIFRGEELESFTQFTLLYSDNTSGELLAHTPHGENIWLSNPDFSGDEMIPSMAALAAEVEKGDGLFFSELTYHL